MPRPNHELIIIFVNHVTGNAPTQSWVDHHLRQSCHRKCPDPIMSWSSSSSIMSQEMPRPNHELIIIFVNHVTGNAPTQSWVDHHLRQSCHRKCPDPIMSWSSSSSIMSQEMPRPNHELIIIFVNHVTGNAPTQSWVDHHLRQSCHRKCPDPIMSWSSYLRQSCHRKCPDPIMSWSSSSSIMSQEMPRPNHELIIIFVNHVTGNAPAQSWVDHHLRQSCHGKCPDPIMSWSSSSSIMSQEMPRPNHELIIIFVNHVTGNAPTQSWVDHHLRQSCHRKCPDPIMSWSSSSSIMSQEMPRPNHELIIIFVNHVTGNAPTQHELIIIFVNHVTGNAPTQSWVDHHLRQSCHRKCPDPIMSWSPSSSIMSQEMPRPNHELIIIFVNHVTGNAPTQSWVDHHLRQSCHRKCPDPIMSWSSSSSIMSQEMPRPNHELIIIFVNHVTGNAPTQSWVDHHLRQSCHRKCPDPIMSWSSSSSIMSQEMPRPNHELIIIFVNHVTGNAPTQSWVDHHIFVNHVTGNAPTQSWVDHHLRQSCHRKCPDPIMSWSSSSSIMSQEMPRPNHELIIIFVNHVTGNAPTQSWVDHHIFVNHVTGNAPTQSWVDHHLRQSCHRKCPDPIMSWSSSSSIMSQEMPRPNHELIIIFVNHVTGNAPTQSWVDHHLRQSCHRKCPDPIMSWSSSSSIMSQEMPRPNHELIIIFVNHVTGNAPTQSWVDHHLRQSCHRKCPDPIMSWSSSSSIMSQEMPRPNHELIIISPRVSHQQCLTNSVLQRASHQECLTKSKSVLQGVSYQACLAKSVLPRMSYKECLTKSVQPRMSYTDFLTKCVYQACLTKNVSPRVLWKSPLEEFLRIVP